MPVCKYCDKPFQHSSSLSRHVSSVHSDQAHHVQKTVMCRESHCNYRCLNRKELITHIQTVHKKNIDIEEKDFESFSAFQIWKSEEERKSKCQYIQQCGSQITGEIKRYYYYCNRSGKYKCKASGKRQLKLQGTCKVGDACTGFIKADENLTSHSVHVEYCFYHHNHSIEIAYVTMDEQLRSSIAAKLLEGVTEKKILDGIRDSVSGDILREHIVCLQDIQNIRREYNVEGVQKHKNDHDSVNIWVSEMKEQSYDPILVYKQQGVDQGPEVNNLAKDDMLLCIQTEFQKDVAVKFGNKIICVDSTHSTTMYDFLLITVMVIDDFNEGVPIAWAVTNREDQSVLVEFFKGLQAKVGDIAPQYFMSDCANQFYNAWVGVFHKRPHKLICTWHVDKAWRNKLSELVETKEKRIKIYHHLRVLLEERDLVQFELVLQQFLSYLADDNEEKFLNYFRSTYVSCKEEWAYAFRAGAGINTNMYVESFHRVLKVVYMERKQNRRVDRLLSILLRFSKDKAFDRISKLAKGKSTYSSKEIKKRHTAAQEMYEDKVVPKEIDANTWRVVSQSCNGRTYTVKALETECSCQLKCSLCAACIHMYTCSCADSLLQNTICKHSHLVQLTLNASRSITNVSTAIAESHINEDDGNISRNKELPLTLRTEVPIPTTRSLSESGITGNEVREVEISENIDIDSTEYFVGVLQSSSDTKLVKQKDTITGMLHELQVLVDTSNSLDSLATAKTHLTSALSSLKALNQVERSAFNVSRKRPASNAKLEQQKRYFSTKKKKTVEKRWAKPTLEERQNCLENLDEIDVRYCAVCMKEEDLNDQGALYVSWIECSTCGIWFHESCCTSDNFIDENICLCKNCMI